LSAIRFRGGVILQVSCYFLYFDATFSLYQLSSFGIVSSELCILTSSTSSFYVLQIHLTCKCSNNKRFDSVCSYTSTNNCNLSQNLHYTYNYKYIMLIIINLRINFGINTLHSEMLTKTAKCFTREITRDIMDKNNDMRLWLCWLDRELPLL